MGVVMARPKNAVGGQLFGPDTPHASKNLIFRLASGQQTLNEYSDVSIPGLGL
jgi:hypothetical protein